MTISNTQKEKISIEVIKTLVTRFESFPEDGANNRNAPFHESFLKAFEDKLNGKVSDTPFFISLSSWLQGLNTTLGQTFFENVAHILCNGEKREYTSKKLGNLKISQTQKDSIATIITDLSNATSQPNLANENRLLFQIYNTQLVNALDFSADVFIEDDDSVTAIELKSVKPNSGEMRGEKQKILEGKAALFRHFPNKRINFYIGFPFDPTVNPAQEPITSFNKPRFLSSIINMNKFFDPVETLIASELWDMLSGDNQTMEQLLDIINTIATTDFLYKYQLISNGENRDTQVYSEQLSQWNLLSELELVANNQTILARIGNDKKLKRIYTKNPFDGEGKYNFDRYNELKKLISH